MDSKMVVEGNESYLLEVFRHRWPIEQWERTGFFSQDFLLKINQHWLKFPPPDPQSHYALAIVYAMVMTFGVMGNSLVICMFLRYVPTYRSTSVPMYLPTYGFL